MSSLHAQLILESSAAQEMQAMFRWSRPYERSLERVALTLLGNPAEADRVVGETILVAWDRFVRAANIRPSLLDVLGVTVRECLSMLRSRAGDLAGWNEDPDTYTAEVPSLPVEWERNPESLYSPQEWNQIRTLALDSLTPLDRAVFLLRDVLQFSNEQTAELIGKRAEAVKARLSRARLRLRAWMNPLCRVAHEEFEAVAG